MVIGALRTLATKTDNSGKFIDVVARVIHEFGVQREAAAEMMEILRELVGVCEKSQAHPCWSAAKSASLILL
jgi:hypothetical protein